MVDSLQQLKQQSSSELRWTFYRHLTNGSDRCPERSDCRYPLFALTRVTEHDTGTRNVTWQSVVWRYLLHVAASAVPFLVHTSGFCCALLQRKEALSWSWIESKPDKRIKYQAFEREEILTFRLENENGFEYEMWLNVFFASSQRLDLPVSFIVLFSRKKKSEKLCLLKEV